MDTRLHGERRAPLAPNRSPPAPEWQPAFLNLVQRFSGSRGEAPRSAWIRTDPQALDPPVQRVRVGQAGLPGCHLAFRKGQKSRDPLDPISARRLRIFIDIHLREPGSRLNRFRGLSEDRRHRPARAAPGRPEIHDHRNVGIGDVPLQSGGINFSRRSLEQLRAASATLCRLGRPIHRHGIDTVTVRANDATFLHRRDSLCKHFPLIWGAFAPATTSGISQMPSLYHHCSWRRPAFTAHHSKERKDTG